MTTPQRLSAEDRQAIVDIMHHYFWLVDHGHAEQTAAFFSDTARLTFGSGAPKPGTIEGKEIPAAMLARSQQTGVTTRHVVSNVALTLCDDASVQAYSLLTLYRSEDSSRDTYPASIADIDDIFVRLGTSWQIQQRTISPLFNRAEALSRISPVLLGKNSPQCRWHRGVQELLPASPSDCAAMDLEDDLAKQDANFSARQDQSS